MAVLVKLDVYTALEGELLVKTRESIDEKIALPLIAVVVPHSITYALEVNDLLSKANPVYNK